MSPVSSARGYWPLHTPGYFRARSYRRILALMSGFVVDSRTLVAVRDTLGRLHDQLVGMNTVVWHQHGTLGGVALESELEHFCATWHYGVAELGGQLQDLTRHLSEAAAAYDRIEQRITHAGGGAGATSSGGAAAGSGHRAPSRATPATHHSAAKHHPATHHTAGAGTDHGAPAAPGGPHYSGGAGLAPASGGTSHQGEHKQSGDTHPEGDRHSEGDKHRHSGSGSGVTVIGGSPHRSGTSPHPGSGSGVTVIGGGPSHAGSRSGSGTTTVDEKIHRAEARQRCELAAVQKMAQARE